MSALPKIPVRMTVAEFFAWNPPSPQLWQLVDGEPQAMAPANRTHGAIQAQLSHLIASHLQDRGGPCSVVTTPGVIPRVQSETNVRIPDLAVTCSGYDAEESALTDPVLLIEILSPSNQAETWANVWAYTTIPSVQEILVLKTASIGAELLAAIRTPRGQASPCQSRPATSRSRASASTCLSPPLIEPPGSRRKTARLSPTPTCHIIAARDEQHHARLHGRSPIQNHER
jgi:Uma2 family endonuclease